MPSSPVRTAQKPWPALPLKEWKDTYDTLHMWMQIVGKVRMELSAPQNHWWHVPFYVTARGLTTSSIPCEDGIFDMEFDFVEHNLVLRKSDGALRKLELKPRAVADFLPEFMAMLHSAGIECTIWEKPVEVPDPIPFPKDRVHASYVPEQAHRFWQVLVALEPVFQQFRSRWLGKSSPVHFFWGSFDLAHTRFSGEKAPPRPGADTMTQEAYSHEESSVGWWPGGGAVDGPAFYAYTVPEPAGLKDARVKPEKASYHPELKEFVLMYDDVRTSDSPADTLLDFLQSTYEAGANLGGWDRKALERE